MKKVQFSFYKKQKVTQSDFMIISGAIISDTHPDIYIQTYKRLYVRVCAKYKYIC